MVLLTLVIQDTLSRPFLGGSSNDLLLNYVRLVRHSAVISDKVANAFGPTRFKLSDKDITVADSDYLSIRQNLTARVTSKGINASVDSLAVNFYPLEKVGISGAGGGSLAFNLGNASGNAPALDRYLKITFEPSTRGVTAIGADTLKNLVNLGFSKKIEFPEWYGDFWMRSYTAGCSELDYLTALAQLVDCKLVATEKSYTFEPDVERIRARFLKTYQTFGSISRDLPGIRESILRKCYQNAPASIIKETVSNPKMYVEIVLDNEKELPENCGKLLDASIARFKNVKNPDAVALVNKATAEREKIKFVAAYSYSFGIQVFAQFSDGKAWML